MTLNSSFAIIPTISNLREIASIHQTRDIRFFNGVLTYVGKKLKDAAMNGKFYCIVVIPYSMGYYKMINFDITITVVVKKLRRLDFDVTRIGENELLIAWGQKYFEDLQKDFSDGKNIVNKIKKKILYDKLGISEKSNPVMKVKYNIPSSVIEDKPKRSLHISSSVDKKRKQRNNEKTKKSDLIKKKFFIHKRKNELKSILKNKK